MSAGQTPKAHRSWNPGPAQEASTAGWRTKGHVLTTGRDEITARMPTHDEAEFLQPPAGVPVLDVLHTSFNQHGDPFEVTRFVHRADKSGLVYTFDIEN